MNGAAVEAKHGSETDQVIRRWLCLSDGHLEALKWIAFGSMLIDHVGRYAFGLGLESWAFAAGRLAFPLFAFVLASNLAREGSRGVRAWRTSRRLAVWALISVLPSWWARDAWLPVNVLATLSIGAALCSIIDSGRSALVRVAVFAVGIAAAVFVEFGIPGVLLVVAVQRVQIGWSAASRYLAIAMIGLIAGVNMTFGGAMAAGCTIAAIGAVVAIQLVRSEFPRLKWIFYAAYPTHFVAIVVAGQMLNR
jgi:hypothetical protein